MHKKTILIVDDEPRSRQGIKKMLEAWANSEFEIMMAANGKEAIQIIQQQKVNILITDIRMPQITGLNLLTLIKEQNMSPVVIVISAYSEFEYAQASIRLGVINYLLKPISKKKLIEAVEDAVAIEKKQERAGIIEKVVDDKLIDANAKNQSSRGIIREAMLYIDNHLKYELTQKEVAEHIHLNPSYFSVLFKEQAKLTFSEYITRRRVQHAKNLLISTSLSVGDVAEESGYKTAKYFIKIFKELEGVTPSAYRKNQK
ncbi:response regulator [Niallia sp. NCCP-28]|uniref:response regulator transcription factor n=1 Tax=Niallia sp. NCCP-28 TaxID=2934712 RepID=UPI00208151A4|nr:response regulator [Niallia sp. NCCP-28]GKU81867.1 DNA-binding response regulator [Niallia sp. NCCP-28]